MARKTTKKSSSRKTTRTKSSTQKSRTPRKTYTRKKTTAQNQNRFNWLKGVIGSFQQSRGTGRSKKKSTPAKQNKLPLSPSPPPIVSGLSLDRKLDLIGVILTLVGLLTLLFLISPNRSSLSGQWVSLLLRITGWGGYILPIGLIGIGLWLILRNFEQIPQFVLERAVGVGLLYLNFLAFIQFITLQPDRESSFALAAAGAGGGYLGAWISETLITGLGMLGTTVALTAWLLIGILLTLDISTAELFKWTFPVFVKFRDQVSQLIKNLASKTQSDQFTLPTSQPTIVLKTDSMEPDTGLGYAAAGHQIQWQLPAIDNILEKGQEINYSDDYDRDRAQLIEETLASFGAPGHVVEINRGPTITQFGVEPSFIESRGRRTRVRVNKIASLADDLALALAAQRIRIQAPVPGKGYVGIEVPNDDIALVSLRDVIENAAFQRLRSSLRLALGQDVAGNAIAGNLRTMPHLLIAGATGSGKSVCVNAIIATLLLHNTPETLRIIMVDPKRVELTNYNGIPHLLAPVVVEMERVVGALQWVTREMDARYQKFSDTKTRNITDYNNKMETTGGRGLPYLVVIIDELADLMMLAPDQTEKAITRLSQLARATGIHLIIATQRPSVDVVTGLIKANLPARIAFAVSSGVDSRVILDQPGAERLLGSGDMLFQAPDAPAPVRLQGVFVSDFEIQQLVHYWRAAASPIQPQPPMATSTNSPPDAIPTGIPLKQMPIWEEMKPEDEKDPMYHEAIDLIRRQGRASISMLQRRLRIGYTRAARLIETLEDEGVIGPPEGPTQTRDVLDYGPAAPPHGE